MKFRDLSNLFYNWGWQIKHEHYTDFSDYLHAMIKRRRVFTVMDGQKILAIAFYYITDDYKKVYKKRTWDIANDLENGHQLYIDKMICERWTPAIYRAVRKEIEEHFPFITEAYYHRAPKDRCIKIIRKGVCV